MRRFGLWLKRIGLAMLALLVIAQFIPVNRRNPSVDPAKSIMSKKKFPYR